MRMILATTSPDTADEIARALLEERLVACANLVPGVRSHYWWKDEICTDEEILLLMETTSDLAARAVARLQSLHPYEVPKIVTIDPADCDARYLDWLESVTRS